LKPLQIGDNYYDPSTGQLISSKAEAGFSLSPGEVRYDSKGNKIAEGAAKNEAFNLSPGENRYDSTGKLIASGGPKPITQAQETAAIAKTEKEQAAQQSASQSIQLENNLLNDNRYESISGA